MLGSEEASYKPLLMFRMYNYFLSSEWLNIVRTGVRDEEMRARPCLDDEG